MSTRSTRSPLDERYFLDGNQKSGGRKPVEVGSLSHNLQGFSTIPGGDRRISEPSTVWMCVCVGVGVFVFQSANG